MASDDPEPKKPEELPQELSTPNQASFAEAVRALTAELNPNDGGWNQTGFARSFKNRKENDTYVITYGFDLAKVTEDKELKPEDIPKNEAEREAGVNNVRALNAEEQAAVRKVLDEIESVANIKFRLAENPESRDIQYVVGRIVNDADAGGYAKHRTHSDDLLNDLLAAVDNVGKEKGDPQKNNHIHYYKVVLGEPLGNAERLIAHETLHALGISHPGGNTKADGRNPQYTDQGTIMSYNMDIELMRKRGMGVYDVATLQFIYGKPKAEPGDKTIRDVDVKDAKYLFSSSPAILDLRNSPNKGNLLIDMDARIGGDLHDKKWPTRVSILFDHSSVNVPFTENTRLSDVIANEQTAIALEVKGNALQNRIQGGAMADKLLPIGGNDIVSGGARSDQWQSRNVFMLSEKSGFNNVITDFSIKEPADFILLTQSIKRTELKERDDFRFEDKLRKAAELMAYDENDKPVASYIVMDVSKADLEKQVKPYDFNIANDVKEETKPIAPSTPKSQSPVISPKR